VLSAGKRRLNPPALVVAGGCQGSPQPNTSLCAAAGGSPSLFLVDNVVTTGATLAAARHALRFGTGLVFADASPIYQPPAK